MNIVSTEHLRFAAPGDTDPNARLFAALQDKQVGSFWHHDVLAQRLMGHHSYTISTSPC